MIIREDPMIPPLGVIDKSVVISSSRKEGSERNRHKLKTCNNTLKSNGDNAANWSLVSSDQESDVTHKNGVAFVVGISHVGNWECIIGLGAIALSTLMKVVYLHFSFLPLVWTPLGIPLGFVSGIILQAILREYIRKPGSSIPRGTNVLLAVGVLLPLGWWDCARAGAVVLTFTQGWWSKAALRIVPSRKPVPNQLISDLGVLFTLASMGSGLPLLLGALTGGFLQVSCPVRVQQSSSESTSALPQKNEGIPQQQQHVKYHHPMKELDAFQPIYPFMQDRHSLTASRTLNISGSILQ